MYRWRNEGTDLAHWLQPETKVDHELGVGSQGQAVRRAQEWLCWHRHALAIDGTYGSITARVVERFQQRHGLPSTGRVDAVTFARLSGPLRRALEPLAEAPASLNLALISHARAHLEQHPHELGGQNRGPWVRMYMEGREGRDWPWCAGFVTFLLRQAAEACGVALPIPGSVSCDTLAAQAKASGLFLTEAEARARGVPAGSLFLVRRTAWDWTHVGIVLSSDGDSFETIEGNTNDDGDREGHEVCARTRGYANKDFILLERR